MSPASGRHKLSPCSFPPDPSAARPVRPSRYQIPTVQTNPAVWRKPPHAPWNWRNWKTTVPAKSRGTLPVAVPPWQLFGESSRILASGSENSLHSFLGRRSFRHRADRFAIWSDRGNDLTGGLAIAQWVNHHSDLVSG